MLRIAARHQADLAATSTLTLPFDQRQKSRLLAVLDTGEEVAIQLERGTQLAHGERLETTCGKVVLVQGAQETLSCVRSDDLLRLTRAAYHLGNRHVALQIKAGCLLYQHDHVLDAMLQQLGLCVEVVEQPFEPESGAYGSGHAHAVGHSHGQLARPLGRVHAGSPVSAAVSGQLGARASTDAQTELRPMDSLASLRWLQLCSSQLPVGAFAYSQGLEQAAERGWVSTPEQLEHWLEGLLRHAIAGTDLPLLARAWRVWSADDVPSDALLAQAHSLSDHVLALRESSELRQEERRLGSALARLLDHLQVARATPFVGNPASSYVVMVGLAAAEWKIPETQVLTGYAFTWVQNQINVACRLLPLGQLEAQALLGRLLTVVEVAVTHALSLGDDEIGLSSPALALSSAWHEQQYTRLFRS